MQKYLKYEDFKKILTIIDIEGCMRDSNFSPYKVPADMRIFESKNFKVDNSSLTGV